MIKLPQLFKAKPKEITNSKKITLYHGDEAFTVIARKSPKSKRLSIKISHHNIELIIPKRTSFVTAEKFLLQKKDWVAKHAKSITPKIKVTIGTKIPIDNQLYTVAHSGKLRGITAIKGTNIIVSGPKENIAPKVKQFLCKLAKEELTEYANKYSKQIGKKYSKISLRDTKSRWGSCTSKGNLSFSWRVIMAPSQSLQYLVAHEVSHLKHMNHSKDFWQLVSSLLDNYKKHQKFLRDNSAYIHSFDFSK